MHVFHVLIFLKLGCICIHVKVGLATILHHVCPKAVIKLIMGFRIDDIRIEEILYLIGWLIIRTLGG